MNTWIAHQIGLEFSQIHIQGTIETQRNCDRAHNLVDQTIQVGVYGTFSVQIPATDIIYCLIVDHEGAIGMCQGCVSGQDRVVGCNDSSGDLRS